MKRNFLIVAFTMFCAAGTVLAQDVPQSQVPSLVVNSFEQAFPKAFDVEWEMDGAMYKVDFEKGLPGTDHEVWYDKTGKLIRHKEEVHKSNLPQKIQAKIGTEFNGYRTDDEAEKITEDAKATYIVELKGYKEKWKVAFDAEGNILNKIAD